MKHKVPALQKTFYKSKGYIKHKSPTILTCIGAAGVVGTAVMTAKATTKANLILEQAEKEKGEKLTNLEKVNAALPVYLPTIMVGAATITCIFGANVLNKRKQASLVSAYGLLDKTYKDYRKKVEEYYGEGSDDEIVEEIAKDKYAQNPIVPSKQTELFYDEYSKRYFETTVARVQEAKYQLNRDLALRDYAYLNEFYDYLGLDPVDDGWTLGWSVGACMDMYWQSWIDFGHSKIYMDDGTECTLIKMYMEPIVDFENYF
jgi:hypothetical protein